MLLSGEVNPEALDVLRFLGTMVGRLSMRHLLVDFHCEIPDVTSSWVVGVSSGMQHCTWV
jgi:hypothetical protein